MEEMSKDYRNLELESNKIPKKEKEKMKLNLQKLHVQKIKWKLHGRNALCRVFSLLMITKKLIIIIFK
jgi:hypothetical protein